MTGKKVEFGPRPNTNTTNTPTIEEWVKNLVQVTEEPMKRLTLDISEGLHRKIKVSCASRGTKMAEEIRALLEAHYVSQ
jgi:hypothetical protein